MPITRNWIRPSAVRDDGGSSSDTSLTTSRKLASAPRVSRSAVSVSRLPFTLAFTPGVPVFCTCTMVGSGLATPAWR